MPDDEIAAPSGMLSDALTPAEQAYFESGGENADAVIAEQSGTKIEPETKPEAQAKPAAEPAKTADGKQAADAKATDGKMADTKTADARADQVDDDTAADIADTDPAKPPPTRVSYHKYRRVEERLKATEAREAELREKFARGDERLRLLAEALSAPAKTEGAQADDLGPMPDPNVDFFAAFTWQARKLDQVQKQLEGTRGEIGQTRESIQAREAADTLKSTFQQDAVAFSQQTPDFLHAYNHMLGARAQMLEDQGYGPDDIRSILANEERGLVQRAIQSGKRPAEMIYAVAQRFGYRKADGATQAQDDTTATGETAAQAKPAAKSDGKPSASEIIANVQKGQAASKTLSGTGGAASDLSVDALVNMSEADFNALLRSKPAQVEALMGRRH